MSDPKKKKTKTIGEIRIGRPVLTGEGITLRYYPESFGEVSEAEKYINNVLVPEKAALGDFQPGESMTFVITRLYKVIEIKAKMEFDSEVSTGFEFLGGELQSNEVPEGGLEEEEEVEVTPAEEAVSEFAQGDASKMLAVAIEEVKKEVVEAAPALVLPEDMPEAPPEDEDNGFPQAPEADPMDSIVIGSPKKAPSGKKAKPAPQLSLDDVE